MAEQLIVFKCSGCGKVETLALNTLQLVGREPWLNANGWRARRASPHRVHCEACWSKKPLAPIADVEIVRVMPGE
jgi:hypothetical protein